MNQTLKSKYLRIIVILALALITDQSLMAQQFTRTLLWEVTNPKDKDTSFLFGTFHEINPDFFANYPNAMHLLKRADMIVLETKLAGNKATGQPLLQYDRYKWNRLLDTAQAAIFETFTTKAEDTGYYNLPPFYAVLALNRIYIKNYCDTAPRTTTLLMDEFIEQQAMINKKSILGLEKNQEKIIYDIAENTRDNKAYAAEVVAVMQHMLEDNGGTSICTLVQQYCHLEIDYQTGIPAPEDPGLLENRNKLWLDQMPTLFNKGRCFVAVGFRHLFYSNGLIAGLRRMGYKVNPVLPDAAYK